VGNGPESFPFFFVLLFFFLCYREFNSFLGTGSARSRLPPPLPLPSFLFLFFFTTAASVAISEVGTIPSFFSPLPPGPPTRMMVPLGDNLGDLPPLLFFLPFFPAPGKRWRSETNRTDKWPDRSLSFFFFSFPFFPQFIH